MSRDLRLTFVVESGTDVRMVEGLDRHFSLDLVCRDIVNGFHINWQPRADCSVVVGPAGRLAFAVFLARRLATQKPAPEIVLVQGYAAAALVANVIGRLRGAAPVMLVCSPVEAYYACRRGGREAESRFRRIELLGLQALARLNALLGQNYVVLSRFLGDVVSGHGARGSIDVVPIYGVDVARFSPTGVDKGTLRQQLGLPKAGRVVFFSSRIAPEKDADTLLRAIGELNREGRAVWLVNRSGGHEAFIARAAALGVQGHVVAGGPVDPRTELPSFYRAADVCVQASREEGLGFSPLEALACGVPVVATDVGGLRETIINGKTGWSYPRGDVRRLSTALAEVFDQPEEAARRTRIGRQLVREEFAEEKVFSEFDRVMQRVAASRSTRRRPEPRN